MDTVAWTSPKMAWEERRQQRKLSPIQTSGPDPWREIRNYSAYQWGQSRLYSIKRCFRIRNFLVYRKSNHGHPVEMVEHLQFFPLYLYYVEHFIFFSNHILHLQQFAYTQVPFWIPQLFLSSQHTMFHVYVKSLHQHTMYHRLSYPPGSNRQ